MTWFKIDDNFSMHAKVVIAGNAAIGLWARCGAWSAQQLQDGLIPVEIANMLGRKSEIDSLVRAGLFEPVDGGFQMHDWDKYQPAASEVRSLRAKRAEAGARGGRSRKPNREQSNEPDNERATSQASASGVASDMSEPPSRPVPKPKRPTTPPGGAGAPPPQAALALIDDHRTPAQLVVDAYVRGAASVGAPRPDGSLCARVGKQAAAMARRTPLDVLLVAAEHAGAGGWHDLAVQVQRDAAAARAPTPRASTTDRLVAGTLALAAKFAQEDPT